MKTENVSGDQKLDRKRKLLPLLALVIGLSMPVYAHAASEVECTWCHNYCTNTFNAEAYHCYLEFLAGGNSAGYAMCHAAAVEDMLYCHNVTCETPGGPCQ